MVLMLSCSKVSVSVIGKVFVSPGLTIWRKGCDARQLRFALLARPFPLTAYYLLFAPLESMQKTT